MANKKIIDLPLKGSVADEDLIFIGSPVDGDLSKTSKETFLTEIQAALDGKADITLVEDEITTVIGGAPTNLNTLDKLAGSLGDDPAFASTTSTLLSLKAPIASPTFTGTVGGITKTMVGLSNVPNTDATNASNISSGTLSSARLATDIPQANITNLTTDLAAKANLAGGTFTGDISVPAEAYGAGWNGSNEVPTKNDLYDKIETLGSGGTVDSTIIDGSTNAVSGNAVFDALALKIDIGDTEVLDYNYFNVINYGAVGDGTTDDTDAFQDCFDAAVLAHGKVIIPSPANFYHITSTIQVYPNAASTGADNEVNIDVEAVGTPRFLIKYSGTTGTACFDINGLRYSNWTGVSVILADTTNLIAFDLDTKSAASSLSNNNFYGCNAILGNATGQTGWRIGQTAANGGDFSSLAWYNCQVYGFNKSVTGTIGWHIKGSNALQNSWYTMFGANLDKMYSNSGGGNGGVTFVGAGTSQCNIDYEISNNQTYTWTGGRFESGERPIYVTNSNVSPSLVFVGAEWNDYTPSDGILFYIDMPCSILMLGCNVQTGPTESEYTANMFKLYGGGGGTGRGRLTVIGGSYEAADPMYDHSGNSTDWDIHIIGVGRQNSTGVNTLAMADFPSGGGTIDATPTNGSTNAVQSDGVFDALALKAPLTTPDFITDISITESSNTGDGTRQISLVNTTTGSAGIEIARNGENPWQFFAKSTNNNFIIGKAGSGDWLRITGSGLIGNGLDPTSTFHNGGSFASAIATISGATTLGATHHTVLCDATSAAFTVTLPAASTCVGRIYNIKKIDSTANAVTVDGNSTELIDADQTQTIGVQWVSLSIQSNGTSWFII